MKLALRILAVNVIAGLVGVLAFSLHVWILTGFGIPGDFIEVCLFGFLVSLVGSVVLVPLLLLVQRFSPWGVYGGVAIGTCILVSMLYATFALINWKRFTLDLPELVGRAWNVYLYFAAFGLAYGVSWIQLIKGQRTPSATPTAAIA